MDMKSLNYFVHAAETLNFTKAAKECYISQTAISLSIAKMEEELGFMLFDRNNRSIRLTPAGRDFYEWACRTLHSYDQAVQSGRNIASGQTGLIRIGFSSTFEGLWFIPYMQEFRKRFSDVHMEQRIMEPDMAVCAVRQSSCSTWPVRIIRCARHHWSMGRTKFSRNSSSTNSTYCHLMRAGISSFFKKSAGRFSIRS